MKNHKNVKNDKFERTVYEYVIEQELLVPGRCLHRWGFPAVQIPSAC